MHKNIAHDAAVDLKSHQRAEIVPVGQRVAAALVRAQQRERRGQSCALLVHVIRVKQVNAALGILVAAPEQRVAGRPGLMHRLGAERPLAHAEKAGAGRVAARFAGLLLVEQACEQDLFLAAVRERGQYFMLGLQNGILL